MRIRIQSPLTNLLKNRLFFQKPKFKNYSWQQHVEGLCQLSFMFPVSTICRQGRRFRLAISCNTGPLIQIFQDLQHRSKMSKSLQTYVQRIPVLLTGYPTNFVTYGKLFLTINAFAFSSVRKFLASPFIDLGAYLAGYPAFSITGYPVRPVSSLPCTKLI